MNQIKNPFQYLTPDSIAADDALKIFVDVFKDYYQILNPGNTFINGPRGSGKSMLFRIMKPDCQKIKLQRKLKDLNFFGIHIPIKNTSLNLTDLQILEEKHGANFLNEHYLVLYVTICIFDALLNEELSNDHKREVSNFYELVFKQNLEFCGAKIEWKPKKELKNVSQIVLYMKSVCDLLLRNFVMEYITSLICGNNKLSYDGPLCLHNNFLLSLLKGVKQLSFMPDHPLYLLIDDADELNLTQTKVLNSWVSFRETNIVCYKISTQLKYQTFHTTKGNKIDNPHDYFEINLGQAYTSEQMEKYHSNVKQIVELRLQQNSGMDQAVTAETFFPENTKQRNEIREMFESLKEQHDYDFAYRNATPEYMKQLSNKYSYSYAGFRSLVHLSSGIIRNFLDLASKMYSSTYNSNEGKIINSIPVNIQDREINQYSQWLLTSEFDKLIEDNSQPTDVVNLYRQLRNLIESLGSAFRVILLSTGTERRKFSFYFDGEASADLNKVLHLGVVFGYFHTSTIGSKSGLSKNKLYILNRMLAPYFKLDPFSFSGYLYLTANSLEVALKNPRQFIRKVEVRDIGFDKNNIEQLDLFTNLEQDEAH